MKTKKRKLNIKRIGNNGKNVSLISKALAVPQQTISDWLIIGNIEAGDNHRHSNVGKLATHRITENHHYRITLFPRKYE